MLDFRMLCFLLVLSVKWLGGEEGEFYFNLIDLFLLKVIFMWGFY